MFFHDFLTCIEAIKQASSLSVLCDRQVTLVVTYRLGLVVLYVAIGKLVVMLLAMGYTCSHVSGYKLHWWSY